MSEIARYRIPKTEAWKQLIELGREKGAEHILDVFRSRQAEPDGFSENIRQEYGRVFSQSRIIKTQEDLKDVIDFDSNKYQITKGYNKSYGVSAKASDGNSWIYNTNYAVSLEWRLRGLEKPDSGWTKQWLDKLTKDITLPDIQFKENKKRPVVVALGDIHVGAIMEEDELYPEYNKKIAEQSLAKIAAQVNILYPDRDVYYIIGGDVIESFTGKNHKNTWKTIELHGAKAALCAFDLLYKLFQSTDGFKKAYMVGGNHDRISSSNEDDTQGQVLELISGVFDRTTNINIEFDPLYLSFNVDGIQYIIHHGDKRLSKKKGSEMVLDYGSSDCYNVILGFHSHHFDVVEDTKKYRSIVVPSIVKATAFAKEIGVHAPSGYATFESAYSGFTNMQILSI